MRSGAPVGLCGGAGQFIDLAGVFGG